MSTKTHNMPLLLIIGLVLKAILTVLAVATVRGCHWAAIALLVMLGVMLVVDAIILIAAVRNGNDVRRWNL